MEKDGHRRKSMDDLKDELAEDFLNDVVLALPFDQTTPCFVQETHGDRVQLLETGRDTEVLHDAAAGHHAHIQEHFWKFQYVFFQ